LHEARTAEIPPLYGRYIFYVSGISADIKLLDRWNFRNNKPIQESCAIAKMTARCALVKYPAVVEIWPFEIIQDGGGRHLEFVRIENSAIRSGVPENPTL